MNRLVVGLPAVLAWLAAPAAAHHGVAERATGGGILYVMPGVSAYWENASFALGVKLPAWTDLNEEGEQQGVEGRERYRVIFSMSALF